MRYKDLSEEELQDGEVNCPNCDCKISIDECLVDNGHEIEGCNCGCGNKNCDCEDGDCDCENHEHEDEI